MTAMVEALERVCQNLKSNILSKKTYIQMTRLLLSLYINLGEYPKDINTLVLSFCTTIVTYKPNLKFS